ncbi:unnamed protein product [Mytilus edulis]|uniref:Uncharacterized protein n=1 Tax=Mytilus edulis TaxID=6550 RepID=A0A8S3QM47_MYTED|nr:unnamed protein product [Mytilus edulis]
MAATSTDTSLVCSFSAFTNTKCGLTPYFPKETEVLLLKYCQRNLKSHLSSYFINDDISTECNLICHRVGIFAKIGSYSVCPYHKYSLGVCWKRRSKCTHPEHTGKGKAEGNRQGVTVAASLHLLQKFGCVVPVGSGLCVKCRKSLGWLQAGEQTSVSSLELQKNTNEEQRSTKKCLRKTCGETENAVLVKKMKKEIFSSDESNFESNFEMSSQETCSQESSWSLSSVGRLEIRNGIHQLNNAIHMLNSKISPVKYMIKKDLNESNASTVRYVKRKANETIHCVLDQIAPGQSSKILELVGADIKSVPVRIESDTSITNLIAKLYSESDNNMLKCQLLSLISSPNMHTKSELMELIPDLTKHKIDQSRTHASQHGPGSLPLKKELSHRNRMDEVKLDHALSFFLNPDFQQICSYGTKKLEFDNGEVVTIPQIVRTTCHSLLIDMYASYCNEEHFNPLSKSTQFKLLATCAAAKRSNLSGLDNISADGATSMDNIIATLQKLQEHDISKDELEETTSDVKALKLYMKTMYKFDIKKTSHCKDHCINFALSNTKDVLLQESCTDHIHDDLCNSCNLLGNVTEQIFKSIQKVSGKNELFV